MPSQRSTTPTPNHAQSFSRSISKRKANTTNHDTKRKAKAKTNQPYTRTNTKKYIFINNHPSSCKENIGTSLNRRKHLAPASPSTAGHPPVSRPPDASPPSAHSTPPSRNYHRNAPHPRHCNMIPSVVPPLRVTRY